MTSAIKARTWSKLVFENATSVLERPLDSVRDLGARQEPGRIVLARTKVRRYKEYRQGCCFAHGLSLLLATPVHIAHAEEADHDCILRFEHEGKLRYMPLQLKELVREEVNPKATLQKEIDKLKKYADADDLVVAVHLNRAISFAVTDLDLRDLPIKELWLLGCEEPKSARWFIMGNILTKEIHWQEFVAPWMGVRSTSGQAGPAKR